MRSTPRKLAVLAVALLCALALGACGDAHTKVTTGTYAGESGANAPYLNLGPLIYQVQLSRELNPANSEDAGYLQRLDLSSKFYNRPQAMNNCDFVIGGYGPNSDKYRAFLWNATAGFQDLNSLIPSDSGWTLISATAINDRGEIVGRGEIHHDDRGFLLIPQR